MKLLLFCYYKYKDTVAYEAADLAERNNAHKTIKYLNWFTPKRQLKRRTQIKSIISLK